MKTYVVVLLCILLAVLLGATASACGVCGSFGSCRIVSSNRFYQPTRAKAAVVVKEVVEVAEPSVNQTFVFNNSAPPTQTVYGYGSYQQAVQPYQASAKELLAVTSSTNDTLRAMAELAAKQLEGETEVNRLLSAAQALQAIVTASKSVQGQSSQSFRVEIRDGKVHAVQPITDAESPSSNNDVLGLSSSLIQMKCGKCHGGDNPAGGLRLDAMGKVQAGTAVTVMRWLRDPSQVPEAMTKVFAALTEDEANQLADELLGAVR